MVPAEASEGPRQVSANPKEAISPAPNALRASSKKVRKRTKTGCLSTSVACPPSDLGMGSTDPFKPAESGESNVMNQDRLVPIVQSRRESARDTTRVLFLDTPPEALTLLDSTPCRWVLALLRLR